MQALNTTAQGKETKDMPVAPVLHINHTLLIMII